MRGTVRHEKYQFEIKCGAFALACMSLAILAVPTAEAEPAAGLAGENQSATQSSTTLDPSCINQIKNQAPAASSSDLTRLCTVTTVIKTKINSVSNSITEIGRLTSRPVYSKTWQIEKIGIAYYEITKGRFYYDGTKAWSTKTYRGYTGYHQCQAPGSWGLSVQVTVADCSTSYSTNGDTVVDRETYKVSGLVNGFPIYWVYAMSRLSKADGTSETRAF